MGKTKKGPMKIETPGWLVTYGDMMSLLLTFFILLFSFSSVQESKFQEAMGSLQGALGVLDSYPTVLIHDNWEHMPDLQRNLDGVKKKVEEMNKEIQALDRSEDVTVTRTERGIAIRFDSQFLFDLASAELRKETYEVLEGLVVNLKEMPNEIRIEGHTDDLQIHSEVFPSNWELSAARASSLIRFFEDRGMDPRRMSAVGYGEWRPVAKNDSPENRQKNRRVEIFVDLMAPDKEASALTGKLGG